MPAFLSSDVRPRNDPPRRGCVASLINRLGPKVPESGPEGRSRGGRSTSAVHGRRGAWRSDPDGRYRRGSGVLHPIDGDPRHAGGLALATFDAVRVLDALGMDIVFVETVGAGQSEVEIATRAHTTVVVEMPMTGDAVQTMKAGILEIGDVYVVNKADLGNEDVLVANLKFQLTARDGWTPSVIRTTATEGRGIDELADALDRHAAYLEPDRISGQA